MKVEGGESRTKKGKERNEENLNGNLFWIRLIGRWSTSEDEQERQEK